MVVPRRASLARFLPAWHPTHRVAPAGLPQSMQSLRAGIVFSFVLALTKPGKRAHHILLTTPCAAVWIHLGHLASDDEYEECEYGEDDEHGFEGGCHGRCSLILAASDHLRSLSR